MIAVFAISYVLISRIVNKTMERVDDCIQKPDRRGSRTSSLAQKRNRFGKVPDADPETVPYHGPLKGNAGAKRGELAEMVADLVHQVNTPLTNIQLYCSFLTQDDLTETDRSQICRVIDSQVEKVRMVC